MTINNDALRMLAWTVGPKDGKARLAYLALIDFAGPHGVGMIDADVLQDRARLGARGVREQLGALERDGFITAARPRGNHTAIFFKIADPIVGRARAIQAAEAS